jgi:cytochrome c biogenesis protein CcdA/copper chaperone CopZ
MRRQTFSVDDIYCDGCRSTIRDALGNVEGIDAVDVDITTNAVTGFAVQSVSDAATRGADSSAKERQGSAEDRAADGTVAGARYGLVAVAVAVTGLAGYVGYVLYPRFDLPAAEGAALLGLAGAAGIASFFSPCSFPLLLGLLGGHGAARAGSRRAARPAVFGGALAFGAAVFMLLLGAAIGIGGEARFADVTFASPSGIILRSAVGVVLIALGLVQLGVLPSPLHAVERLSQPITRGQARLRRHKPVAGFALFGFGYVLAGFG